MHDDTLSTIAQYAQIKDWVQSLVGSSLKMTRLAQSTSRKLRTLGHPVFFSCQYDDSMTPGDITLAANYYDEFDDTVGRRFVEIILISHPDGKGKIKLTAETLQFYAVGLVECLVHEYQHRYQYEKRKFLYEQEFASKHSDLELARKQRYLGMKMEIDAFSINIAARLHLLYGEHALEKLALGSRIDWDASPDLYSYHEAFEEGHVVLKTLHRKIATNIRKFANLT